ncbi:MAG: hypothetical protein JWR10_3840 [Rubritepida sp.]|nr:hypothetical protein [Rubritepida sp.]
MKRLALALILALGACATDPNQGPALDPGDPYEATNRQVLDFNNSLDSSVLRPVAEAYRDVIPEPLRNGLRNFLRNLNEPVIFANNVLQLRLLDAGQTLMRFYVNTTAGGLGLFDVATPSGIARVSGDFGQTLYAWGVPDGPFLMLPLLGPTTVRDALGEGVDSFASPVGLLTGAVVSRATAQILGLGRGTLGGLDLRAENIENLDILRADSLDFYARLRSVVRQRRDAELGRSSGTTGEGLVTLDDPGAAPAPTSPGISVLDDPGAAGSAAPDGAVTLGRPYVVRPR